MLQTKDQCRGLLRLPFGKLPGDHFVFSLSTFDVAIQLDSVGAFFVNSLLTIIVYQASKQGGDLAVQLENRYRGESVILERL